MSITEQRLKDYQLQMSIYAEQHQMLLASDVLDMVEQLQDDLTNDKDKVVEQLENDEKHTFDGCINKRYAIEIVKDCGVDMKNNMKCYTQGNADNIDKAVEGLDIFTKNWCMNCSETNKNNRPVFRCSECNFVSEVGMCSIKEFVIDKTGDMPTNFGSMSR